MESNVLIGVVALVSQGTRGLLDIDGYSINSCVGVLLLICYCHLGDRTPRVVDD